MEPDKDKTIPFEKIREMKHDIKNELSGMILCLEQLRFELNDPPPDWIYYMDSIGGGFSNIIKILDKVD
jgi:hypothetical protein